MYCLYKLISAHRSRIFDERATCVLVERLMLSAVDLFPSVLSEGVLNLVYVPRIFRQIGQYNNQLHCVYID